MFYLHVSTLRSEIFPYRSEGINRGGVHIQRRALSSAKSIGFCCERYQFESLLKSKYLPYSTYFHLCSELIVIKSTGSNMLKNVYSGPPINPTTTSLHSAWRCSNLRKAPVFFITLSSSCRVLLIKWYNFYFLV